MMGCHIRQHNWQKLKMVVVKERWRELFPNAATALATLGGMLALLSGAAAAQQSADWLRPAEMHGTHALSGVGADFA